MTDVVLEFSCPRCAKPTSAEFYGPCPTCTTELRRTVRGERAEIVAAEYEPTMHVTPNAVALKE